MPEGLEAEIWRAAIAGDRGPPIIDAWVDDRVAATRIRVRSSASRITGVHRVGKVVLIDTSDPRSGCTSG